MPERVPPPSELDVDARFLLANERTLLAWVRTALTLLAAGVGIEQFGDRVAARTALALVTVLAGVAAAVTGAVRFSRADAALRAGRLPKTGRAPYALAFSVAIVGIAVLVAVLTDR